MKNLKTQFLLVLFTICLFTSKSNAQDFEGVIHYEMPDQENDNITQMSYMVKGEKTRLQFGDGEYKGAMIYLPEESKIVMLIDSQKGYMSMDAKEDHGEMDDYSNVDARKTGETKTIAGKQCEVWKVTSEDDMVEACMAKGMGTFMMPKNPMAGDNTPQWAKELMDEGAMPLEVVEIKNGNRSVQMVAKKIEEKSLSNDIFEIPEGYRDMSEMMKRMQQMRQH